MIFKIRSRGLVVFMDARDSLRSHWSSQLPKNPRPFRSSYLVQGFFFVQDWPAISVRSEDLVNQKHTINPIYICYEFSSLSMQLPFLQVIPASQVGTVGDPAGVR